LGIILAYFRFFFGGLYTNVDITPRKRIENRLKRTPKSTEPDFCKWLYTIRGIKGILYMTALDSIFINNTYDRVMKQAPHPWYEDPTFAYIPLIGALVSSYAQFSFNAQLDEWKKVLGDIPMTSSALSIQKGSIEHCREMDQLVNGIIRKKSASAAQNREKEQRQKYENWNKETAELQKKVEALHQESPRIASRALKLIEASNQHAIVSIIQSALLSALIISMVVLEILNPAIGIPLFMVCAGIIAGHSTILAQNKFEKIPYFTWKEGQKP
jgi:hypothetical protein